MPISYSEKWYDCPNQSSRGGSGIVQVTFHTTEGSSTGESLANWICQEQAQASYHAAVDNTARGEVHRFVDTGMKAWSQAGGNPFACSVAFCTPAGAASGWSRDYWLNHQGWMLENAAAIARKFCDLHGIPLTLLNSSQAQSAQRGISQHSDGGSGWSGHHDCGSGFPEDYVLQLMGGTPSKPPDSGQPPSGGVPTLHVDYFGIDHNSTCPDVQVWQQKMYDRGWHEMLVDGDYGPISKDICLAFQREKGLAADGYVGPETWNATWTLPT